MWGVVQSSCALVFHLVSEVGWYSELKATFRVGLDLLGVQAACLGMDILPVGGMEWGL